jgi:hypothetical protein
MRYPPKIFHINALRFNWQSRHGQSGLSWRATTSAGLPEKRQLAPNYIREAVPVSCHDSEEEAKNFAAILLGVDRRRFPAGLGS